MSRKVICDICGKEISTSNIKKHLVSHETHPEYHNKIIRSLDHDGLICKFCNKEYKNRNSLAQHEIRCCENPNRINVINKNFNEIGKIAWNKGLTKETDERVRKNSESIHESYLSGKSKALSGDLNPSKRLDVRNKISETCLMKSKEGTWHKSLAKNMHYNYNGVDLDGTWELSYAIYLDNNNIRWNRCTERFPYEWQGKIHFYTPDFYLIDTSEYIEIKGYQTDKDIAKWEQFPATKKLIILKEADLKKLKII